ncbi:tetratricopeptide repeat protein [Planctomycetota bacterium]|nr:tetratricopeptide repeat protein [Planctomycetota bacterium]
MVEGQEQSDALPEEVMEDVKPARSVIFDELHWSQVWHVPLLLLGIGLFCLALYTLRTEKPDHDFDGKLAEVAAYLDVNNLEDAKKELDELEPVLKMEEQGGTIEQQGQFYLLRADLLYMTHADNRKAETEQTRENNRVVLKYYDEAVERGVKLEAGSIQRKAETLLALGKLDRVNEELKALDHVDPKTRRQVFKKLVEYQFARRFKGNTDDLIKLITDYSETLGDLEPREKLAEKVWVVGLNAQLMLEAEDGAGAADYLTMQIMRLRGQTDVSKLWDLRVKLAKACQMMGELDRARGLYREVQAQIKTDDPLNAEILTGLGSILLMAGDSQSVEEARANFTAVTMQFPDTSSDAYLQAMIGLADCEARLGEYPASMDHFRQAVAILTNEKRVYGDRRKDELKEIIQAHIRYAMERSEYEQGLEYLQVLSPLYGKELPADLILSFALTHEKIAEVAAKYASKIDPKLTNDYTPERLKAWRHRNQQSVIHYGKSAERYLEHARAVTISSNELHGESLWAAAANYDKANDWQKSVDVYAEFIDTRESDSRRWRGMVNHGKALFALSQYDAAAEDFRGVIQDHPRTLEAYESRVMLARTFEKMGEVNKALRGLEQVIEDDPVITPDSKQYREALIELGRLYYQQIAKDVEQSENAIEVLTKAVERYGDQSEGAKLRYWLADAYRQSVEAINLELDRQLSHKRQLELSSERNSRLQKAQSYFQSAKREFEMRKYDALTPLEKMYLRNSYFYRADCAFDQQHYEQAIGLYDEAARKWEKDPASMVALVQIVNAYCELGQFREAKIAHDNALLQLQRIPDDAFKRPGLPMDREHWENWLRWDSELRLLEESAGMAGVVNNKGS